MNSNFFREISNPIETNRQMAIKSMKQSGLPTVIYGAGLTAENVYEYLKDNHINVCGFIVDKGYGEHTEMSNLPVELLEFYQSMEHEGFNIVIALQNVVRAIENLSKKDQSKIRGVYSLSDQPSFLGLIYDYEYLQNHENELEETYASLSDQKSKETMLNYVNSIINNRFDINVTRKLCDSSQYFAEDIINLKDDEVFVDCGAYNGDTLWAFMNKVPGKKCRKYYALEPDSGSCSDISKMISCNSFRNVEIIRKGVWENSATLKFTGGTAINSCISSTGSIDVEVDSIDNMLLNREKVTFIKMDVQGVELPALRGTAQIIKKDKPKLAICIYHKPEDIFRIPLYIKSINPSYKFYMRHHSWSLIETVLYAL